MVHQYSNGTGSLKYIITSEGRLLNTGTNAAPVWGWEYDLKDHLGNVRVIFKPNATNNGVVRVEYANYFPFGMKMLAPYSTFSGAKYLYNGKEYQDDFGLNWYDYGARMYDAAIGRWHSVDPRAEDGYDFSPYVYVADNPIINVDPDGEFLFTAIGAIIGGASTAIKGGSWNEIWKGAAAGAVAGAVIDITVATGGTGGALIAAGAVSGMAGEATNQLLHEQSNPGDILKAGALGATMGMLGEMAGPLFRTAKGLLSKSSVEVGELSAGTIVDDVAGSTPKAESNSVKLSKVQKSKNVENVGDYTKSTEVRPGKGPGQSRSEYVRYKNKDGKVIRTYKDSYDRANNFQHRKPLRGGPEGRPQN